MIAAPHWMPDEEGGYELDLGIVCLNIDLWGEDDGACRVRCSWLGDDEWELCPTLEAAKIEAVRLGIAHLQAAIDDLRKVQP